MLLAAAGGKVHAVELGGLAAAAAKEIELHERVGYGLCLTLPASLLPCSLAAAGGVGLSGRRTAAFCVADGACLDDPDMAPLRVRHVLLVDDAVYVSHNSSCCDLRAP